MNKPPILVNGLLAISAAFLLIIFLSVAFQVHEYHDAARAFWGEYYHTHTQPKHYHFPESWFMASNGPLINVKYVNGCNDSFLTMIPARLNQSTQQASALCGYGTKTRIIPLNTKYKKLAKMIHKLFNTQESTSNSSEDMNN